MIKTRIRTPDEPAPRCSFCNKAQAEVRKLIAGPTACICDECMLVCNDIIREDENEPSPTAVAPPSPANPNRTAHSTDWYAPASWSGRQPDPFPSRQEKLKRQLREMSDRRRQHQNQSRAFWR